MYLSIKGLNDFVQASTKSLQADVLRKAEESYMFSIPLYDVFDEFTGAQFDRFRLDSWKTVFVRIASKHVYQQTLITYMPDFWWQDNRSPRTNACMWDDRHLKELGYLYPHMSDMDTSKVGKDLIDGDLAEFSECPYLDIDHGEHCHRDGDIKSCRRAIEMHYQHLAGEDMEGEGKYPPHVRLSVHM